LHGSRGALAGSSTVSPLRELDGLERLAELECNEAERAARRRQKAKAKFLAS
jgi:hypothetical protein